MQIDMNRFRAAFFDEAGEHLTNMEAALLRLEFSQQDPELLNTIFRAAHSIKGASSTFGIDSVARFTHVLENLLDRMRDGQILPTKELCQLLLQSTDVLSALITAEKISRLRRKQSMQSSIVCMCTLVRRLLLIQQPHRLNTVQLHQIT